MNCSRSHLIAEEGVKDNGLVINSILNNLTGQNLANEVYDFTVKHHTDNQTFISTIFVEKS